MFLFYLGLFELLCSGISVARMFPICFWFTVIWDFLVSCGVCATLVLHCGSEGTVYMKIGGGSSSSEEDGVVGTGTSQCLEFKR